jgi:hypothetical protein
MSCKLLLAMLTGSAIPARSFLFRELGAMLLKVRTGSTEKKM